MLGKEGVSTLAGYGASNLVYDKTNNQTLGMIAGILASTGSAKGLNMADAKLGWSNKGVKGNVVESVTGNIETRVVKGKKILVKGNHDDVSDYRYKQLFYDICDYREIHDSYGGKNYDLVLCHYPIFSWKGMNKGTILLYGHTHNSAEDVYFQKCLTGMEANNCRHVGDKPIQAYNVGCMKPWIDYEPRSLKEIIEKYHNIK